MKIISTHNYFHQTIEYCWLNTTKTNSHKSNSCRPIKTDKTDNSKERNRLPPVLHALWESKVDLANEWRWFGTWTSASGTSTFSLPELNGRVLENEHWWIDLIWFDYDHWHLLYFLFFTKMIIYSVYSCLMYTYTFFELSSWFMCNKFYPAFEGHSEQAVEYSINNVFPKFYGSVGLDVSLLNCLYC